ncbi:MAG: rod shape-determining protein RodA [Porticoccaceae bacterium]|jgi:rod shape determining protein RodA|nr:rod shape-determining protein RodA [Porticoccaceae bacterium]MBT6027956.1 rod shape-determining protein RodA [Porticoccaceae bacterium]MBT6422771.1 rod shape-determining protein RodA [Porticoccaceae bacterium]
MQNNDFVRRIQSPGGDRKKSGSAHIDFPLLTLLVALCGLGLMVLYSAGGQDLAYVKRQATFMVLGFIIMFVVAQFEVRYWEKWAFVFYSLGLLLLIVVLFFGVGAKGAQRWLDIGFTRLQPAEFMKVGVPLMLAAYLSKRFIPPTLKHISWAMVMIMIPAALIMRQPDLGTALLVFVSGFFTLFLAGLGVHYLIGTFLTGIAAVPIMWNFVLLDYQKQRLLTLLSPEKDRLGSGWNIVQSKTAIGSGGLNGKGWTEGTQSQLNFLPESHTDFIIAVLAEEFGLIGILILLTLYTLVIARCSFIALKAQSQFGRLLAGSLSLIFFIYVFVNMGMVSGILPVVGAPLPMISYGGTAILTLFIGFGLLMAISTEPNRMRTTL